MFLTLTQKLKIKISWAKNTATGLKIISYSDKKFRIFTDTIDKEML